MAVLLPFLALMFVIAVDFARVFYYSLTIENAARNGALYASDPIAAAQSPYTSLQQAVLADTSNLSPPPSVSSSSGIDGAGNAYVTVTVSWQFSTITSYPGIPSPLPLSRTVQMRVAHTTPQ
jgi:Flp pilus assembly protein TadG